MPYKDPELQRTYQSAWLRRRRNEWLLANGPCIDCGSWDELEVDHVDAKAKVSHRVWSWTLLKRQAELLKCVVRCATCHATKTKAAKEYKVSCGERNGSSKLTEDLVRELRKAHAQGFSFKELAQRTGTDSWTISKACRGITWKHIDP